MCVCENNFAKILLLEESTTSIKNRINLTLLKKLLASLVKVLMFGANLFWSYETLFASLIYVNILSHHGN